MSKEWIKEKGFGPLDKLTEYMTGKKSTLEGMKYIAMYPDSFKSGVYGEGIGLDELLEARIFNEDRELLISRSGIGEDFSWRIASEKGYSGPDKFFYERYQLIDINAEKSTEKVEDGCMSIVSTVGGKYSLPITGTEKRIKIITYVDYDENGMAYAADNRICGFVS